MCFLLVESQQKRPNRFRVSAFIYCRRRRPATPSMVSTPRDPLHCAPRLYRHRTRCFSFRHHSLRVPEEALFLLQQIWHQPIDEQNEDSGYQPIIYMSFGSNSSISKVRKTAFDFDPFLLDTTVASLDAQITPQQSKIARYADAGFAYLLKQFNVPVYHPDNSGNASMYATIVAILSALHFELYGSLQNAKAKPG